MKMSISCYGISNWNMGACTYDVRLEGDGGGFSLTLDPC